MAPSIQSTHPRLPYRYYTIPVLILLILGLADTGYLAWLHYQNYTNLTFNSFCALSKSINCDTVSQSPWSIFFGIPLALWGFFAYSVYLLLFLPVLKKQPDKNQLWYVLFFLALIYSGISLYLGYISTTQIKAHCILCMVSYAISFFLLIYSWIIIRRFCTFSPVQGVVLATRTVARSPLLSFGLLILCGVFIFIKLTLPPYWHFTLPPLTSDLPQGLTDEGHPWIGAINPKITIHEYADYQCFQCGKMHQFLRNFIAEHPDTIRLVHHHYPMDHEFNNIVVPEPFYIGSGKMAMIAIYAASKNRFWKMNDALYAVGREKQAFNTRFLAEQTGFTAGELAAASQHPQIREALLYDIRQGMKLHITGTPSYVIDGQVYTGSIPAELLQKGIR